MTVQWEQQQKTATEKRLTASKLCGSCYAHEGTRPSILPLSGVPISLCDQCSFDLIELELLR